MEPSSNVLFVLADQLGARWLPVHHQQVVSTPVLERFASGSTVFERAITTAPVCTPYRGCLLSGLFPSQTGVLENGQAFPAGVASLADQLNECGYATHYIGKWHLSGAPQENRWVPPEKRAGFQSFIGWESHHVDHYAGLIWQDDPGSAIAMPGHETDALTDLAIGRLQDCARSPEPFCLMVSYQAPHPPCTPPEEFLQIYDGLDLATEPIADRAAWFKHEAWQADYDINRFRQLYFAEISQLDAAFGRILEEMERLGLYDNTLIVFTSDHGEMAGAHGIFGKGVMYEESLHVPLIINAPGQAEGTRRSMPVSTVDIMPTLLDYAGAQVESGFEGRSLRAALESQSVAQDRVVISEYHNFCASTERWKLVTDRRRLVADRLHDIVEDPFEQVNRLGEPACAEIQLELSQALARWHERVVAQSPVSEASLN